MSIQIKPVYHLWDNQHKGTPAYSEEQVADLQTRCDNLLDALQAMFFKYAPADPSLDCGATAMARTALIADRKWTQACSPTLTECPRCNNNFMECDGEFKRAAEFDRCDKSPTGKHSESWFVNDDCEYCNKGALSNAPLYVSGT